MCVPLKNLNLVYNLLNHNVDYVEKIYICGEFLISHNMKDKDFIIERFKTWDYGYKSLDCFELSDRRFIVRLESRGFRFTSIPHLVGFDTEEIYVRPQSVPSSYGYLYISIHLVKL